MLFENVDKSKEPRITVTQQGVANKPAIWFHQVDNGCTAVLCLSQQVNENLRIYIPNDATQYSADADGVKSVTLVTEESFNHWWKQVKSWLDSNLETTIVNWVENNWNTQFQPHVDKTVEKYNLKMMNDNDNSLANNGKITYENDSQQPRGIIPKIHDMIKEEISIRERQYREVNKKIDDLHPVGYIISVYNTHSITRAQLQQNYLRCDGSVIPSGSQYNDIRSIVGQSRKITLNNCSNVSQMYNLPNGIPSFWIPNISFMEWVRMSPWGNNINLDGSETLTFYEFYWDNGNYDFTGRDPGPYFPTGVSYSSSVATSRVSAAGHAWCDAINVDLSTAGNFYYSRRGSLGLTHSGYRVDERLLVGVLDYSSGNDKEWVVWAPDRDYHSGTTNTTRWGIPFYSRNYDSMYLIAQINGGPSSGTKVLIGVLLSDSGWSVSNTYGYTVPSVSALDYYLPDLTRDGTFLGGGSLVGGFREGSVPNIYGNTGITRHNPSGDHFTISPTTDDNQVTTNPKGYGNTPGFYGAIYNKRVRVGDIISRADSFYSGANGGTNFGYNPNLFFDTTAIDASLISKYYKKDSFPAPNHYKVEYWIKFKNS